MRRIEQLFTAVHHLPANLDALMLSPLVPIQLSKIATRFVRTIVCGVDLVGSYVLNCDLRDFFTEIVGRLWRICTESGGRMWSDLAEPSPLLARREDPPLSLAYEGSIDLLFIPHVGTFLSSGCDL